jgi:glycerophosphoryl diester phosphodiesterase
MKRLLSLQVDGIFTDDPITARLVIDQSNFTIVDN